MAKTRAIAAARDWTPVCHVDTPGQQEGSTARAPAHDIEGPAPYRARVSGSLRHVIWDFNGTLLDDLQLCLDIIGEMLAAEGLPELTLERYHEVFDFPVRDYYERIGFDVRGARFARLARVFMAHYRERVARCPIHPQVEVALVRLAERGLTHSVLSAAAERLVDSILLERSLRHHFVAVVGLGDDHAAGKVERGRQWLRDAARKGSGFDGPSTLLVGDTTHDAEVARELGVRCALLACGHHGRRRLEATGAPVYASIAELIERLAP